MIRLAACLLGLLSATSPAAHAEELLHLFAAGSLTEAMTAMLAASGLPPDQIASPVFGPLGVLLVRVKGGGEGRWDHHSETTETVVVWSGAFTVEFRDHTVHLSSGQCCVVPVGAEHRGTSRTGAEVVLFQQAS